MQTTTSVISTEARFLKGEWLSQQTLESLLAAYGRSLAQDPTQGELWGRHAYCLVRLKRYPEALNSYQQAISLCEDDAKLWCNYGSALATLGQFKAAVKAYDRALDLMPQYVNVWRRRGRALYRLGRYVQAIESYDHALALDPQDGRLWFGKGLATYQIQQTEQAIRLLKTAIQQTPTCHEAHLALVYILVDQERYRESLDWIKPLLTHYWNDVRLYQCYAYLMHRRGDDYTALAALNAALTVQPDNAHLWFQKGLLLARLERLAEAQEAFKSALERQADDADGWLALGILLRRVADPEAAIAALDKALTLSPSHPLAFFHQACCYASLGHYEWATEHLRRAIALDARTYLLKAQREPLLNSLPPIPPSPEEL